MLYADEHDDTVQQVSLRHKRVTPTGVDSCGEGCAQLDDFNWFLPADGWAGDLPAPESEIEESDSESEVEDIEPDSTQLQTNTRTQQLLCPPVVAQTRPMEGCNPALPRRLRRGRDVLMEDGAGAVDTERVSAASDAVVSQDTHMTSVRVPTVVPKLAAAPQAASEVVQPRPPDSGCTDLLPPVGECQESLGLDTPDAGESGMEVACGSPPAEIDISVDADMLQTAISVTTQVSEKWMVIDSPDAVESGMEMAGGSPPAEVDISVNPDVLPTARSVTTQVSEKWMVIDSPDAVESGMEMAGGSPPAEVDISVNPDVLPTARSVTTQVSEKWMVIDSLDAEESGMEMAGGSPPAEVDISVNPDVLPTATSVTTQVSEKWMVIDSPDAVESGIEIAGGSPPAEVYISVGPDVLPTAISVMTVVSEEWMERFVVNLDVLCSDGLASGDDPAGESSDVGSDVCMVPDPRPTEVSVRTVVTEKWMDRFVIDLVECPSVSRTSTVARTFGSAVSEEYFLLFLLGGGDPGEVADAYPLVVVKSDTARVSVLPVAGCKFPAIFWGEGRL